MKKINNFLILIIALVLLPLSVKADMGVPMIGGYDAIITNINGVSTQCYDRDGDYTINIPYDTKIVVNYEEVGSTAYIEYNEMSCPVSINDIKPFNSVYEINEEDKLQQTERVLVIEKNGVAIYNGPSTIYENLGVIPYDTELNFDYALSGLEGGGYIWLYIEYNGLKGWISILEGEAVVKTNNNIFTVTDADFYNENNQKIETIPKFTELKDLYYYSPYAGSQYYLVRNNVKGHINSVADGVKLEKEETVILEVESRMTKNLYSENDEVIINIPKGTELKYKIYSYDYEEIIYTSYEGNDGWVVLLDKPDDEKEEITTTTTKPVNRNEKETISAKELIYICIGGAVILSLTAVVTIILINKKNKSKNNEIINNTQE